MRPALASGVLLVGLAVAASARAMTCSIGAVTGLAFGAYDIFSGNPLDSAGTITYRCDDVGPTDSVTIQLSRGGSASFTPRTLLNGAFVLEYNLYLDPARSSVWGDGSAGTSQHGPVLPDDGADTDVTVYGRIQPGQNAQAGSYSDTVVVTVVF